mgnify:CR=1 FL=1
MNRVNFNFLPQHQKAIQNLSQQTGDSQSNWLRRMIDYCYRTEVLNQMVPYLSGQLQVGVKA